MNVAIEIHYRDGNNFKESYEHVFKGPLDPKDVLRFLDHLSPELGFVPTAVDLPHAMLSNDDAVRTSVDMPWHDVLRIKSTDADTQDERTFKKFVDEATAIGWDDAALQWEIDNPEPES